jgi:hypothetical protein
MGGLHFCILDKKIALGSSDFVARSIESKTSPSKPSSSCSFPRKTVTPTYGLKEKNMKTAKSLVASVVLTLVIAISSLAGEIPTPPNSPCNPGEIPTPPCATAQAPAPGETDTPPAAALGQTDTPPVAEVSLTEIASSVLLSMLSLF